MCLGWEDREYICATRWILDRLCPEAGSRVADHGPATSVGQMDGCLEVWLRRLLQDVVLGLGSFRAHGALKVRRTE